MGTMTFGAHLQPKATETYDLGASSLKWKNIYGSLIGNADTATAFAAAKSVALTGDVTGSASSTGGWSIATTIGSGKVTNAMLAGSITNAKLANSSVSIAGNSVSLGGSVDATTLRTSLGLSNAMHFLGVTTTAMSDGLTTAAVSISGTSTTPSSGDVVLDDDTHYEYVWSGSYWELLGGDSSYALSSHTHDYLPLSGGTLTGSLTLNNTLIANDDYIYGDTLPATGTEGQIFFLTDGEEEASLPTGGTAGQALIKNSSTDGDASWATLTYSDVGAAASSHTHNYLPLTGGTLSSGQIQRTGSGGAWYNGRDRAIIRSTSVSSSAAWYPLNSNKTTSGSWETGILGENYYFCYVTDTDYNAGTNAYDIGVYITPNQGIHGAVWNDYAEYRISKQDISAGKCVVENGDDTLSLSSSRMQSGAEIVSDTFGFAIGETNKAKTPIAVTGRVLAYGYEDREEFRKAIGRPVCSGPKGTVSIMSDEEYRDKGYCALGFVSAVPDYEEWGTGKVKVDGRIWIRIR